jgi:hypothetical protein
MSNFFPKNFKKKIVIFYRLPADLNPAGKSKETPRWHLSFLICEWHVHKKIKREMQDFSQKKVHGLNIFKNGFSCSSVSIGSHIIVWSKIIMKNDTYSRVHISSDEVFSKILRKLSIVQKKMIPHMKAKVFFSGKKKKRKKKIQKKNSKWPT